MEESLPPPSELIIHSAKGQSPPRVERRGLEARRGGACRKLGGADPGRELGKLDPDSEDPAPVDRGFGSVGPKPRAREMGCGTEKRVPTYWLWPPSRRPPCKRSPWGAPPPPAGPGPRGAVAARTACQHQLPLRPRAPPLGGNGQRACARTVSISSRGVGLGGVFSSPAVPSLLEAQQKQPY